MAEPLVQDGLIGLAVIAHIHLHLVGVVGGGDVAALMQQQLDGHTGLLVVVIHELEVLGCDVVVVEAVDHQCGALDLGGIQGVIADLPEFGEVAVGGCLVLGHLGQVLAVVLVDGAGAVGGVAAAAVEGQPLHVGLAEVSAVVDVQTLGVQTLVPAGDAGHGDDGLQTLDTQGGQGVLGGAGVGAAGHADLAVGPVGVDGDVAGGVGEGGAAGALVQPFDDTGEGIDLQIGAAGLPALGILAAQAVGGDDGEAANQEVVIPVQVLVGAEAGVVGLGHQLGGGGAALLGAGGGLGVELAVVEGVALALVEFGVAGVGALNIGAGLKDDGSLIVALHGGAGELDEHLDEIQLAVAVGVIVGLDPDAEADDVVGGVVAGAGLAADIGEDGLGQTLAVELHLNAGGDGGDPGLDGIQAAGADDTIIVAGAPVGGGGAVGGGGGAGDAGCAGAACAGAGVPLVAQGGAVGGAGLDPQGCGAVEGGIHIGTVGGDGDFVRHGLGGRSGGLGGLGGRIRRLGGGGGGDGVDALLDLSADLAVAGVQGAGELAGAGGVGIEVVLPQEQADVVGQLVPVAVLIGIFLGVTRLTQAGLNYLTLGAGGDGGVGADGDGQGDHHNQSQQERGRSLEHDIIPFLFFCIRCTMQVADSSIPPAAKKSTVITKSQNCQFCSRNGHFFVLLSIDKYNIARYTV